MEQRDLYKPENVVAFLRSIESNSIAGMQYRRAADRIERLTAVCEKILIEDDEVELLSDETVESLKAAVSEFGSKP